MPNWIEITNYLGKPCPGRCREKTDNPDDENIPLGFLSWSSGEWREWVTYGQVSLPGEGDYRQYWTIDEGLGEDCLHVTDYIPQDPGILFIHQKQLHWHSLNNLLSNLLWRQNSMTISQIKIQNDEAEVLNFIIYLWLE